MTSGYTDEGHLTYNYNVKMVGFDFSVLIEDGNNLFNHK